MIFQHTWLHIIQEQKTATRRVIRPGEAAVRGCNNRILAVTLNARVKWEVGRTYAVQPRRGVSQVGRIRLTRIRSERLSRISTVEARAEGFQNRQDFLRTWRVIHGQNNPNPRVWVLEFELVAVTAKQVGLPLQQHAVLAS